MRKPKVFGTLVMVGGSLRRQCRVIVKATSMAKATEALNANGLCMSLHEFRGYACETGNVNEMQAMRDKPEGTVLVNVAPRNEYSWVAISDAQA